MRMKGPGSGGSAGQGHVRYRAFAQVATGCVTPKKTPQASETRDVRTTAELNLPFNSPEASPHTLRTDPTPGSGRQLQNDPAVFSAPVEPNPAHRILQLLWKSASAAKLLQNGGGVRKPFVGFERAKGFESVRGGVGHAVTYKKRPIHASREAKRAARPCTDPRDFYSKL